MRAMCRPWGLAVLLLASLIATSSAVQAEPGAAVHVNAVVKDGAVRLEARATGSFEYSTSRPSEHMLVVIFSEYRLRIPPTPKFSIPTCQQLPLGFFASRPEARDTNEVLLRGGFRFER